MGHHRWCGCGGKCVDAHLADLHTHARPCTHAHTHAHLRTGTGAGTCKHTRARAREHVLARMRVHGQDTMDDAVRTVEKAYKDGRDAGSARRPPQRRACGHRTQRAVDRSTSGLVRRPPPVCVRCSGKAAGFCPSAQRLLYAADTWLGTRRTLAKMALLKQATHHGGAAVNGTRGTV